MAWLAAGARLMSLFRRSPAPPSDFDVFEDQVLVRGDTGLLCRGRHRAENRPVSIMLLPDAVKLSAEELQRCREESTALGDAACDHILPVVGSGTWKGRVFFAMEDVEGDTLASHLQSGYRFSATEILQVAEGVGRALKSAEEAGIVHGAIRPSAIFLTSGGKVRLAGFGTRRDPTGPRRPATDRAALRYQSPEQIRKEKLSVESDLYSLGVVLYELATGKTPFDGFDSTASLLYQIAHVDPPSTRQYGSLIPLDLDRLILRCLQKDRECRSNGPEVFLADVASIRAAMERGDPGAAHADDLGDFEIHEDQIIGEGGMGTLHRGRQKSLGRPVAIKVIRGILTANPDCVQRFRREAELLAQVNDPSVVQVFGTGSWKGRLFYAMELVEGEDLAGALAHGKMPSPLEILDIAEGVARALKAAWAYRIVHRDIKPSNILITPDRRVKVADFGLAKSLRFPRTDSQLIAGTSEYISPEQAMGAGVDIRSDLYSLGVVMYELVSGRPPFRSEESFMGVIYQHVHHRATPLKDIVSEVPEPLAELVHRCLSKDPRDRFRNPEHFLAELASVRRQVAATKTISPLKRLIRRLGQSRRALIAEGAVLVLILTTSVAVWGRLPGRLPESQFQKAYALAIDLGDFATAMTLAEQGPGRASSEFKTAERRFREAGAAECLRQEDWGGAASLFRILEMGSSGGDQSRYGRARDYCEALARARALEASGDSGTAAAIYERLLAHEPVHAPYLRQRLDGLRQPR